MLSFQLAGRSQRAAEYAPDNQGLCDNQGLWGQYGLMVKRPGKRKFNANDEVTLFPGYGLRESGDERWLFEVDGAIYDPQDVKLRKRMLLNILQRVMKIEPASLESPLFQERIRTFVASAERGQRISIRIGEHDIPLRKKSNRNGRFSGRIYLSDEQFDTINERGQVEDGQLKFEVVVGEDNQRLFCGRLHLLDETGTSVVSDIDDTIKHTNVTCRRELVENTFFREFRGIDAIAEVYQRWANCGADFHYVSSSPWQLQKPLDELFCSLKLPPGTMHLRSFHLREQMLRRVKLLRRPGKSVPIRKLMKTLANRDFVFVGDSRERDPEMYAKLAHRFPGQVLGIFIREFDDRPMDAERVDKIDQLCGDSICHSFRTADELQHLSESIFCPAPVS